MNYNLERSGLESDHMIRYAEETDTGAVLLQDDRIYR